MYFGIIVVSPSFSESKRPWLFLYNQWNNFIYFFFSAQTFFFVIAFFSFLNKSTIQWTNTIVTKTIKSIFMIHCKWLTSKHKDTILDFSFAHNLYLFSFYSKAVALSWSCTFSFVKKNHASKIHFKRRVFSPFCKKGVIKKERIVLFKVSKQF